MGLLDYFRPREKFASGSIADPAFAGWLFGVDMDGNLESVTPYTVWGLSAVIRSVSVISTTIASLPFRTYERQGDARVRIDSEFDEPYPGADGMTPFAWHETVLIHLLLWRNAFLWHEARADGTPGLAYRPIDPGAIEVKRVNGRKVFKYVESGETKEVGTEQITHIPGPSIDGLTGHPLLYAARRIFQAALAGDKTAATALSGGIRLAGLVTPGEGEDIDPTEGEAILEALRPSVVGAKNAGNIAFINRRLKLDPWTPTNVESQWHETRQQVLGEIGRLFGVPAHLLNDTEKQTSWGTGVAEQNLGLQRFTLMGWSSRIEQTLARRLGGEQFCEYDYKGLLQGTPAEEIQLLIAQKDAGILDADEVRRILNLPPLTAKQKAAMAPPAPIPTEVPAVAAAREPDRSEDLTRYAEIQHRREDQDRRGFERMLAALASREPTPVPDIHVDATTRVEAGAVQVATPPVHVDGPSISVEPAAVSVSVEPTPVSVSVEPAAVSVSVEPTPVQFSVEQAAVTVTNEVAVPVVHVEVPSELHIASMPHQSMEITSVPAQKRRVTKRDQQGRIAEVTEEPE